MLLLKGRKRIFKQPTPAWAAYIYFTMHDTFNPLLVFRDSLNHSYLSLSLTLALSYPWIL